MKLAVIPARGGSKRIPRKNIKPFAGKPMIAYSIDAARLSGCFDRIIVSTDDEEIATIARRHGAETPFLRPAELADDHSGTIAVIAHAIGWFRAAGVQPEAVCCIYATAPFVRAQDLAEGLAILAREGCDYVFPVASYPAPIQRAYRVDAHGRASMMHPACFEIRSQDLEEAWHDAGQFYWGRPEAWQRGLPIATADSRVIRLPRQRVQDIDTPEDWEYAELLFRMLGTEGDVQGGPA